jgi:FkbM family methyltransferase
MFTALHDLDKKMLKYLNYTNGIFIEAGANNGINQSNTYYLEKELGWKGLLVEPNYILCEECKKNRINSICENYALVSDNYNQDTISGNFNSNDSYGLMCMVKDEGDYCDPQWKIERDKITNTIKVQAITLNKLLEKHNITNIDFFSLDVEGYEISVLNGLNLNKYRPKFMLIESANREILQNTIREYMLNKNYKFIERLSQNDDLFIDKLL